jgi:hypothetical membrane protein
MKPIELKVELVKFMGINMTTDAFSIIISGLLLVLVLIYNYGVNPKFLLLILSYIISAYKVNCMIVGSCHFYAKVISITTLIIVIFIIINKQTLNLLKNKLVDNK